MDIMELGAIGELVGGVAVIGSLLYLGLQVRQSNRQGAQRNEIERNDSDRSFSSETSSLLMAMTDADLAGVFRRGLNDLSDLSLDEQLRLDMWLSGLLNHCVAIWRRGLMQEPYLRTWVNWLVSLIKTPGGTTWWISTKLRHEPGFVEEIDSLIQGPNGVPAVNQVHPWFATDVKARA